jgi:stearoyl-CoA desaturase (delta-9 desaturase)
VPSNYTILRILYFLCHVGAIFALTVYFSWSWLAIGVGVYLFLQVFGMGIALHRYLSHKAFTTGRIREVFLIGCGTLCGMGSPISWASVHRYHHQTSDTDKDPHSPHKIGVWRVLLGQYNSDVRLPVSLIKDLTADPLLTWTHRYYFLIHLSVIALLAALDVRLFLYGYALPIVLCYWATAGGIVLNHTHGYRNHDTDDLSRNSWILSLYTLGDGWHNNHHRAPKNHRHGEKPWEVDLCANLIELFFMKKKSA